MSERRFGLWLAFASLAVNAPRLMLAYLKADGITLGPIAEPFIIGLSGIANGIVLAGAGIVIAHALARSEASTTHKAIRPLMLLTWFAGLLFATALITPVFVSGIRSVALSRVLANDALQWGWSAVAVVAVEVAAAGCMLADAALNSRIRLSKKSQVRTEQPERQEAPAQAKESEPAANVIPLLTTAKVKCELCDALINDTKNARNAHARFCKGKREAATG